MTCLSSFHLQLVISICLQRVRRISGFSDAISWTNTFSCFVFRHFALTDHFLPRSSSLTHTDHFLPHLRLYPYWPLLVPACVFLPSYADHFLLHLPSLSLLTTSSRGSFRQCYSMCRTGCGRCGRAASSRTSSRIFPSRTTSAATSRTTSGRRKSKKIHYLPVNKYM